MNRQTMEIFSAIEEASRAMTCFAPACADRKDSIPEPAISDQQDFKEYTVGLTRSEIKHDLILESDGSIPKDSFPISPGP